MTMLILCKSFANLEKKMCRLYNDFFKKEHREKLCSFYNIDFPLIIRNYFLT